MIVYDVILFLNWIKEMTGLRCKISIEHTKTDAVKIIYIEYHAGFMNMCRTGSAIGRLRTVEFLKRLGTPHISFAGN